MFVNLLNIDKETDKGMYKKSHSSNINCFYVPFYA